MSDFLLYPWHFGNCIMRLWTYLIFFTLPGSPPVEVCEHYLLCQIQMIVPLPIQPHQQYPGRGIRALPASTRQEMENISCPLGPIITTSTGESDKCCLLDPHSACWHHLVEKSEWHLLAPSGIPQKPRQMSCAFSPCCLSGIEWVLRKRGLLGFFFVLRPLFPGPLARA